MRLIKNIVMVGKHLMKKLQKKAQKVFVIPSWNLHLYIDFIDRNSTMFYIEVFLSL